jgi:kumamolisin
LDATAIHSMAPEARIVVLATDGRGDATYGPYPAILAAMRSYAASHRGVIMSQSYGSMETGTPKLVWQTLDRQLAQVSRLGATMVVSNGDCGDTDCQTPLPAVPWPASSPHVTAVAGTGVHLDDAGNRLRSDTVWSDVHGQGTATGGGLSAVFPRPAYQDRVRTQVGNHRATSDFAMNADTDARIIVRSTYNVLGGQISNTPGWYRIAGTSEAAPLTAGLLALVRQAAHRPLGDVNPALYALAANPARSKAAGLMDVTSGCNAVAGNLGFCARTGWDVVSGNGTTGDAGRLVPALAAAARH